MCRHAGRGNRSKSAMALTRTDLLERMASMRLSRIEGSNVLYKPLLLLLLLERAKYGERSTSFASIETPLTELIAQHGGDVESVGQPWWHLPTDRLWRVLAESSVLRESGTPRGGNHVPSRKQLRTQRGEFPAEVRELIAKDPALVSDAIERVLVRYFAHLAPRELRRLREGFHIRGTSTRSMNRRPYTNVGLLTPSLPKLPFDVDPDEVDRANQLHATTVDALADFLRAHKIFPLAATDVDPLFDLAWAHCEHFFVAEVKGVTDDNEEKQLRLGLGQVLRYRQRLQLTREGIVAVLVASRRPAAEGWPELCDALGIRLVWPEAFPDLLHRPEFSREPIEERS
jgi:hypothetical protein